MSLTRTAAFDPASLHDEAFALDPHPVWRRLRDEQPLYYDPIDNVYLLTRHADVLSAFFDTDRMSSRLYRRTLGRVFGPNLLQMQGPEHLSRRRLVAPLLIGDRLAAYRPLVDAVAREVVEPFRARGTVDIVQEVAHRLPGLVILTLLGLPVADRPQLFAWYDAMMSGLWDDPELRRKGRAAHEAFAAYVQPYIERRQREPADDLISRLVTSDLDPDEIPSFLSLLLTAGGETTDKAISNLWFHLLTTPDLLASVREDPALLDAAFAETMRASPSLVYVGREAVKDFEWHGVRIPEGAGIRLGIASGNRDERVFSDPDEFMVPRGDLILGRERRNAPVDAGRASHLAFGAGPHFCLGYELARLETVTVSRHLLEILRDPRLAAPVQQRVDGPSQSVLGLPVAFSVS